MRPSRHLLLSAAAGGVVWAATGEPASLPLAAAVGTLIDVDHAPDLWWTFALGRRPTATLLLHGWEWLGVLLALGVVWVFPWWLTATIVAYALHLVGDQVFNHGSPGVYFLLYRARHRFRLERLAPLWDYELAYETLRREVPLAARLMERWRRG